MDFFKKVWDFYSVKLILALGISTLLTVALKISVISGLVLLALVIYFFIHSFKDPAFKKKKLVTRIFIYLFMAEFLVAGFLTMVGQSDNASDSIRGQLTSSSISNK